MSEPYCACGHCLSAHASRYELQETERTRIELADTETYSDHKFVRVGGGYCLMCGWGSCPRFQEGGACLTQPQSTIEIVTDKSSA